MPVAVTLENRLPGFSTLPATTVMLWQTSFYTAAATDLDHDVLT